MRLSKNMAGIVMMLCDAPADANNFLRVPLAVLASAGLVNVVDGKASLTPKGVDHVPQAYHLLGSKEAGELRTLHKRVAESAGN